MDKRAVGAIVRNLLFPLGMLAFFLLGFYTLERFYPFGVINGEIVTVDNSLSGGGDGAGGFQIDQVIKRTVTYPVYNLIPVDRDRFVFTDNQTNFNQVYKRMAENGEFTLPKSIMIMTERARIGVMNVNDDRATFLGSNMIPGSATLSPDRSQLLYVGFKGDSSRRETLLLDLASGETVNQFDEAGLANLFIDRNTIMSLMPDTLTIRHLEGIDSRLSISTRARNEWWYNPKTTGVPEQFCLVAQTASLSEISCYDLLQPGANGTGRILEGSDIDDYIPLNEKILLYRGSRNGTKGIYALDRTSSQHTLLRQGVTSSFDVAPGNNKIAYPLQNGSGTWELHAAWLRNGKLEGDRLIYGGLRNLDSVKWSPEGDSIFCVSLTMEGSALYRFTLK